MDTLLNSAIFNNYEHGHIDNSNTVLRKYIMICGETSRYACTFKPQNINTIYLFGYMLSIIETLCYFKSIKSTLCHTLCN